MIEKARGPINNTSENYPDKSCEFFSGLNPPMTLITSSSIRQRVANSLGIPVLAIPNFGQKEEQTQLKIDGHYGLNGGITPYRHEKTSPLPLVLEIASDKAKEVLELRNEMIEQFLNRIAVKIQALKEIDSYKSFSENELQQMLITSDPTIKSLFLLLVSLENFMVVDSTWCLSFPDNQNFIQDPGQEGKVLIHKPKDYERLIELFQYASQQKAKLQSTSGVVVSKIVYNPTTGRSEPRFEKKTTTVNFGPITPNLIEFLINSKNKQNDYAAGLSSFDILNQDFSAGKEIEVIITDYTNNPFGDLSIKVSNPSQEKRSYLSFNSANFHQIIAFALGIIKVKNGKEK